MVLFLSMLDIKYIMDDTGNSENENSESKLWSVLTHNFHFIHL